jgi:uncharacterized protein
MAQTIPAVGYLELGDVPRLVAQECVGCGALYFDRRNACARCSGTEFGRRALSNEGVLRAYTIVHRDWRRRISRRSSTSRAAAS